MDLTRREWIALLAGIPVLVLAGVYIPWILSAGEVPTLAFWLGVPLIVALAIGVAVLSAMVLARTQAKAQ